MRSSGRRRFLRTALGVALWGAGAGRSGARAFAQRANGPVRETVLRGELLLLEGAGGNIVLLGGPSGIAMVDSGSPEHQQAVASFIAERFRGAPIEILLNTHWHLDHTGGNEVAARDGARIIAHRNTGLWMSTEFYVNWQDRTYPARPPAARPTETFYSSDPQPIELVHAGEPVEYGLLREAHTDGDIYVRFPALNVIVAGGAVTVGRYPVLDFATGGLLGGLIDATRKLLDMSDAETLIVPAAGPARARGDLEAQLDMLATVRERIQAMARQGKSAEEMLAAGITDEFDARWGSNAPQFVANAYDSLYGLRI